MIRKILSNRKLNLLSSLTLFLPPLLCFALLYQKESKAIDQSEVVSELVQKSNISFAKRKIIQEFLAKYKDSNENYIEKNLETLKFLEGEKKALDSLVKHPAFKTIEASKRFDQINLSNKLEFIEEQPKQNAICKETNLHQKDTIELDQKDLLTLLHLIEDEQAQKPQLIIKSLSLKKTDKNTFCCKIDLLKREFFQ